MTARSFLLLVPALLAVSPAVGMVVARRGAEADVKIVVSESSPAVVGFAAREFRDFARRMTGVELPVVTDAEPVSGGVVLVGRTKFSTVDADDELGDDGFRIDCDGERLEIAANGGRGALYGVYETLRRFGGCEWFAPGFEEVPGRDVFEVPDGVSVSERPAFALRETDWRHVIRDPVFSARLRLNGQWHRNPLYGGDALRFAKGTGWCHTFWRLVPPKKLFAEHPEWFSEVNGRRIAEGAQICWSNPEVTAYVVERVKELLRADPSAKVVGVSQNDCGNYCTCAECAACAAEEGSQAGPNLRFVNRVAEEVEKEFPGVLVETLAYQFTRKPPKTIRPRKNVAVCLCSFECAFATPFEESWHADTRQFCEDIRGWGEICGNLLVYNYAVNFRNYLFPFPNIQSMAANYRLFARNGARWVYDQADSNALGGEFAELKAYLQSKLMWNPDQPLEPLVERFLDAFYGPAAQPVGEYLGRIHAALKNPSAEDMVDDSDAYPCSVGIYGEHLPQLSEEFLDWADALWSGAEESVKDDPRRLLNVRMAALPVKYVRLKRRYERDFKSVWATTNAMPFISGMEAMKPLAADFISRLDELKRQKAVVSLSESPRRSARMCDDFRALSAWKAPAGTAASVSIGTNRLSRIHGIWLFPLREIACDEGVEYRIRVRARRRAGANDSAGFSAGFHVPWLPHAPGQRRVDIPDLSLDWEWRDVGTFDLSALQKLPLPTMDGLVLYASREAEVAGFEIDRVPSPQGHGATVGGRIAALEDSAWDASEWISVVDQPVYERGAFSGAKAAKGVSWFYASVTNSAGVKSAKFMTTALGVYDVYVNGVRVGDDFLKPGFTHCRKTRYSFTYDVTGLMKTGVGEVNGLAAEVGAGWWRDKIVTPNGHRGFMGRKSAFRGVLELVYEDGSKELIGTRADLWRSGMCGRIVESGIFDGECYDERRGDGTKVDASQLRVSEVNDEFRGRILPTDGAEVALRRDLALDVKEAYVWKGASGAVSNEFGRAVVLRRYSNGDEMRLGAGETLVVDFGQNAAAVPEFDFAAKKGVRLFAKPAEMLNDGNGEKLRGNDGPALSVYRANLREAAETGCRAVYIFGDGGDEKFRTYNPRFTFYGYRYVSITATGKVRIRSVRSIPVTSVKRELETGSITTGVPALNRFIENARWSQYSNYLSVPTDCPQRNERLGWAADAHIFAEAGAFNADTYDFMRKWMRDMRDSQHKDGAFPSVAPYAQYGNEGRRFGWGDAGIIVPYVMWRHFGDVRIIEENWGAMTAFAEMQEKSGYRVRRGDMQYADWLSYEKYETYSRKCGAKDASGQWRVSDEALGYWNYLGGCYRIIDMRMMSEMAAATGRDELSARYARAAEETRGRLRREFFFSEGRLIADPYRDMQTPALFALKCGLVDGEAKTNTIAALAENLAARGNRLSTGFLGTSILLDTLSENGMAELAYTVLLGHDFPGWLYTVDQGATTIWERWNSYTRENGFGPVGMNSFNHYAYGSAVGWLYRTAAGIAPDPADPGFSSIVMKPKMDPRLGFVKASLRTRFGIVRSEWAYVGGRWVWSFSVPEGSRARVSVPGENEERVLGPGTYSFCEGGGRG